jgi:hypothetical protein
MNHGGNIQPDYRQLNYFIDDNLFKTPLEVTTFICEAAYMNDYGKLHHAYDVVPLNRKNYRIYWNRSKEGKVIQNFFDEDYGFCLFVEFEA